MRWGIGLGLLVATTLAHAAELRDVRVWDSPASTRVVLDVSAASASHVFTLSNPNRVVIDLDGIDASGVKVADHTEAKGVVRGVRGGVRGDGVRVVLDVAQQVSVNSFALAPNHEYGDRVVVDLTPKGQVTTPPPAAAAPAPTPVAPATSASKGAALEVGDTVPGTGALQDKPVIIAIDAGHGGEDPGAHGPSGLKEKDVTLAIARKLALMINTQPNMRAVLTRDGDYYVGLRQRVEIARKQQADMFISIHCNAFTRSSERGTAVYVLSNRGVSSEQARWLANKENAADFVGGVDLHDKDDDLAATLIDLSQSATMEASFDVGSRILHSMGKINTLQRHDVQQAAFVVLKAPDIPSVLVETAFITNPHEEKLLGTGAYQSKLAGGILKGIEGYFHAYRPKQPQSPPQQLVEAQPHMTKVSAAKRGGLQEANLQR
ncbi:N-acetylmuramoyl-L-alanine amidase [Solimonas marina]|uniref:N-acetylmuramoyl-L-alanine amidase AmiC n=1 Tax=Solimonas marina TaxID=2714601 RepID=A0A970B9F0_9GAMM|nr:N-acetylmuramoyl-L-alanine amidase [Solimonas marina]NKF23274.1 AMIN domain-containing protein [Solimonas marina]